MTANVAFLLLALAVLAPAQDWTTGVVTEISKGRVTTGANAEAGGWPGPTVTVTETGIDYTDYTIRTDDKLFVMRPYPAAPKEHAAWKILRYSNVLNTVPPPPKPVTIPVVAGDKVDIIPWGDEAFLVRYRNRQYVCAAVRQALLAAPATR